jgi:vitamin-K-epoxide reductase (warfarin-sensitive)
MRSAVTLRAKRLFLAIAALSLAGVVVSAISLAHHYATSQSSFCDFGGNFNCDLVNRSIYSSVLGVPVALIGIVGYAAMFLLAAFCRAKYETPRLLLVGSLAGLGFALYLTYIEAFVLAVWCILCLSSLAMILATTALSGVLLFRSEI